MKMNLSVRTYSAYSIGCVVVWAAILSAVTLFAPKTTAHTFFVVFGGWMIGWLSATIARLVYPPPKRWQTANAS
jgi:hypothetical protein